jgi:hypothetical protein
MLPAVRRDRRSLRPTPTDDTDKSSSRRRPEPPVEIFDLPPGAFLPAPLMPRLSDTVLISNRGRLGLPP